MAKRRKRKIAFWLLFLLLTGVVLFVIWKEVMQNDVYGVSFKKGNMVFQDTDLSVFEKEGIEITYAKIIYPTVSNGLCEKDDISVIATNENYGYFTDMQFEKGAFFNRKQAERKLEVVVVNKRAAYALFGNNDCVGEIVYLNRMPYQVIGIAEEKQEDKAKIYISDQMLESLRLPNIGIGQIWCKLPNMADMTLTVSKLGYRVEDFDILQRNFRRFLSNSLF